MNTIRQIALRCVVGTSYVLIETKKVTYFTLNSSQSEMGLPESTSMPPFPGLSDFFFFKHICSSLTCESCSDTRRNSSADETLLGM